MFKKILLSMAGAVLALQAGAAAADPVSDFYAKKEVNLYVASGPGSFHLHSTLLAPFLTKYIPGNPKIIVHQMPGAGGAKAANFIYAVAPKDGTAIANLVPLLAVTQAIGSPEAQYDAAKLNYLGSIAATNSVLATWTETTPAKTFEEMKTKEVILGSAGPTSITFIGPTMSNQFLGTKFKIIQGYPNAGDINFALEKKEVHGRVADVEGILGVHPTWIPNKLVTMHFHTGLEPDPAMPGVPRMIDLATKEQDKKILEFIASGSTLGRLYVAPPNVPADRVKALQEAFMKAVNDPEYKKFLEDRKLLLNPKSGPDLKKIVDNVLSSPPEVINPVKALLVSN